jgi:hypothetical protein
MALPAGRQGLRENMAVQSPSGLSSRALRFRDQESNQTMPRCNEAGQRRLINPFALKTTANELFLFRSAA